MMIQDKLQDVAEHLRKQGDVLSVNIRRGEVVAVIRNPLSGGKFYQRTWHYNHEGTLLYTEEDE